MAEAGSSKKGVLFVCLGNICRSPAAEAVFKSVVEKQGRSDEFEIDSCGTGGGSRNWYLPLACIPFSATIFYMLMHRERVHALRGVDV
jgi:hypothetical protein